MSDNQALELTRLDILGRLDRIAENLTKGDPELPVHMSSIHKALLTHEELVHILPDSAIRTYMQGMQVYKKLQLAQEATKTRSRTKQSADDF